MERLAKDSCLEHGAMRSMRMLNCARSTRMAPQGSLQHCAFLPITCGMPVEHSDFWFAKFAVSPHVPPEPRIFIIFSIFVAHLILFNNTQQPKHQRGPTQSLASSGAIGSVGTKPNTLPISAPLSWSSKLNGSNMGSSLMLENQ